MRREASSGLEFFNCRICGKETNPINDAWLTSLKLCNQCFEMDRSFDALKESNPTSAKQWLASKG